MRCSRCGNENSESNRFCGMCGAPLQAAAAPAPKPTVPTPPPVPRSAEGIPAIEQLIGAKPALGRLLQPEDDQAVGAQPVAVISHGLWQRAFGADPSIIGQSINLNGTNFTIVGVAAKEFGGTLTGASFDVWLPMAMQPQAIPRMSAGILQDRSAGWIGIFGRLKTGVGLQQAQAAWHARAEHFTSAIKQLVGSHSVKTLEG